ncbi:MAG: hypothetical protein IT327_20385 [Anaerolineae bacterium]|nr:hypothetical protein [Anaerolineae bacterium]
MASQLPDSLVDDITDFFLLDILKEEDRKTLCLDAHFTTHSIIQSKSWVFTSEQSHI